MKTWSVALLAVLTISMQPWTASATTGLLCGDGIRSSTEQCDEGAANGAPGQGCTFSCTIAPGCYCDAPIGQTSTCSCNSSSNNWWVWLLLGLLGLCCCLLLAAAAAALLLSEGGLGGGSGGYGGYGGRYGGYGGYGGYPGYGGWYRGLSEKLFGKAAPAPTVEAAPSRGHSFLPALVMPGEYEMPIRELEAGTY